MSALKFCLPMPENLANARLHHMAKHRRKVEYWNTLDTLRMASWAGGRCLPATQYRVPAPPLAPLPHVRIDATLYLGGRMDDDNALARLKWIADFLKTRRYIVDDKQPHCKFTIPEQVVKRDGNYRVELTVTMITQF